jgi:hypothetical protein
MSLIYLYEKTPLGLRRIAGAETKVEVHRNRQEQEKWELSWIAKVNEENKLQRVDSYNEMEEILESHGASAKQQGFKSPKISGVKSTYQKKESKQTTIGQALKDESNLVPVELEGKESIYNKY